MIRKLKTGSYRLYSRKKNPKTGKRRNFGHFSHAGRRTETRTRRSVLQTGITSPAIVHDRLPW